MPQGGEHVNSKKKMEENTVKPLRKIWFVVWIIIYIMLIYTHFVVPAFDDGLLSGITATIFAIIFFGWMVVLGAACMSAFCAAFCYPVVCVLCRKKEGVWLWMSSIVSIVLFLFLLATMSKCGCVKYHDNYDDREYYEQFRVGH